MRNLFLSIIFLFSVTSPAYSADCRYSWEDSLRKLKAVGSDPDLRSSLGQCLVRHHLGRAEVARQVVSIIRDKSEDVLLREDLIQALGDIPLRKRVKVEAPLAPDVDRQAQQAVDRTVASAQALLAVTQAIDSMDEILPVTSLEWEVFKALSDVASDAESPVLLRQAAVETLESATRKIVGSGVYDPRNLRLAEDTLKEIAGRDDNASYYSGAGTAYGRLAVAGIPFFRQLQSKREIASQKVQ